MSLYAPLDDESVLSVKEAAEMFKLSESTIRRGIESGRIPGAKVGGVYRAYIAASRSYTGDDEADQG